MNKYDRLFEFIPYLESISIDDVVQWSGGKSTAEGVVTMPYPIYNDSVRDFIESISALGILDKEYLSTIQLYSINPPEQLDNILSHADEKLAIALLTYYVRQERFCDGLWAKAIKEKIFFRIIERLHKLQTEF